MMNTGPPFSSGRRSVSLNPKPTPIWLQQFNGSCVDIWVYINTYAYMYIHMYYACMCECMRM